MKFLARNLSVGEPCARCRQFAHHLYGLEGDTLLCARCACEKLTTLNIEVQI